MQDEIRNLNTFWDRDLEFNENMNLYSKLIIYK